MKIDSASLKFQLDLHILCWGLGGGVRIFILVINTLYMYIAMYKFSIHYAYLIL